MSQICSGRMSIVPNGLIGMDRTSVISGPSRLSACWTDLDSKPASAESKVHGPFVRRKGIKMLAAVGCGQIGKIPAKRVHFGA